MKGSPAPTREKRRVGAGPRRPPVCRSARSAQTPAPAKRSRHRDCSSIQAAAGTYAGRAKSAPPALWAHNLQKVQDVGLKAQRQRWWAGFRRPSRLTGRWRGPVRPLKRSGQTSRPALRLRRCIIRAAGPPLRPARFPCAYKTLSQAKMWPPSGFGQKPAFKPSPPTTLPVHQPGAGP